MQRVLVVNGPNLNLLGTREPEIYGTTTLPDLEAKVREWGRRMGLDVLTFQSNHEGAIIDRLHEARHEVDGLLINGGAFTHSSYAIHDAIVATDLPTVEIHISNIMQREGWRRRSVTAPACLYAIYGRGLVGYRDALRVLKLRAASPVNEIRYGAHDDHVMDLRVPDGAGPHPTAVFLHGGFWLSEWTRDTIDGLAVDLHRRGWLTANVEYRRLDGGGGWPETCDDVAAAIEALGDVDGVDPGRLLLVGHSAGGLLALLADTPATVLGLASITDLAAASREGIGDGSVDRFLGGAPSDVPDRYAAATPRRSGDVILVHGDEDHLVPVGQSRAYAAGHPAVTLVERTGAAHFELLDPDRDHWRTALEVLGVPDSSSA